MPDIKYEQTKPFSHANSNSPCTNVGRKGEAFSTRNYSNSLSLQAECSTFFLLGETDPGSAFVAA